MLRCELTCFKGLDRLLSLLDTSLNNSLLGSGAHHVMVRIIDVHGILLAIYTSEFSISGSLPLLSLGCLDRLLQLILQIVNDLEVGVSV